MNPQQPKTGRQAAPIRALTADPARSAALPGHLYGDPAVLAAEKEKIFFRSWSCVGHASELPNPGDYLCARIIDQELFVLRDRDGVLRAFFNVCQHRAHELLKGRGNVAAIIVCPYHAWSYDLDGTLRKARGTRDLPDFDPAAYGLEEVRLETPLGFLFVNLDPNARPLKDTAGAMFDDLARNAPWIDALVVDPTHTSREDDPPLQANWKVLAENCLECYHCGPAHPAYSELVDIGQYRLSRHGAWMKSEAPLRSGDSRAYRVAPEDPVQRNVFWHLFPNIEFGIMPGIESLYMFRFEPTAPEQTRIAAFLMTRPGAVMPADRTAFARDVLWPEDVALCESVQRGLKSRGYRRGRFVVPAAESGISEANVHEFQRRYAAAMGF